MPEFPKILPRSHPKSLSFIPLGGLEDVTRNLYVYEYENEILIVDCGLGFPDEGMLGVDLLLPDITYLMQTKKKIVGLALTHGHEDHIGALPFVLPQLAEKFGGKIPFPIYATPLTASFANEKLKEFKLPYLVQEVKFENPERRMGNFTISFIRITHSVPDTSNIFIRTPAGNFYHGSDFKFDLTPADGKRTDFHSITKASQEGILCLMCDCLGSERSGYTASEYPLERNFEEALRDCKGKFIVTTYSSNLARLQQVVKVAENAGRKVCFIGRSLIKAKGVGQKMGHLQMKNTTEVLPTELRKYNDNELVLLIAGSQGQENSALTRIANGDHHDVTLSPHDVVVFSSDTIPGNEISVTGLIDAIAKIGARVLYSDVTRDFHVSGHGSQRDLELMISLTRPKYVLPISGKYKHMAAYKSLAQKMGYQNNSIIMGENGQEIIISKEKISLGRKIPTRNVFVDEVSGEEIESFVLRDREKLAKDGIVIIMVEIRREDGQLAAAPDIIARGFSPKDNEILQNTLGKDITSVLGDKKSKVKNWVHIRKTIEEISHKSIYKKLHRRPLILPVVIEV
jgi:ribonuclease J